MKSCFQCGKQVETRPYGPGGSLICYPCGMSTPESRLGVGQQYDLQMGAAAAHSTCVIIGEETGPRPILHNNPLQ